MAIKDLWFIGDKFVHDTYHTIQDIQKANRMEKRADLFIQEEFNLKCFTARPLSLVRNVATRLINALIKALSDTNKLPKIIVIIPHDDLAKFLYKGLQASELKTVFTIIMDWMVSTMIKVIRSKKEALIAKKPRSVAAHEPKVIWVKMLYAPNGTNSQFLSKVFNAALNEALVGKKGHFLMEIEKEVNLAIYKGVFNELSPEGVNKYWRELNRIIRRFKYNEISLRPFDLHQRRNKFFKDNRTTKKNWNR